MLLPPMMMSLDEIIPRDKWGADLPRKLAPALRKPAWTVAFVYTETEPCKTQEECIKVVQRLQRYHTDRGMYDIPYNFILGGDLHIYEGRGWNTTVPVPWQLEELPNTTLVVARIGPMADDCDDQCEDFLRGYDLIHFGILKILIDPSFYLRPVYYDWNRHEVVHGFQCDKTWPSIMKEIKKKVPGFRKYVGQW